jgi:hypothetical protein
MFALVLMIAACATTPPAPPPQPVPIVQSDVAKFPVVHEYELPKSMTFCGTVIDLTDPDILEMFDREFTVMVWDRAQVFMWMKRAGRFFPYFQKKLAEHKLPDDLKYLAVAESSLHPHIKSGAGALGMWQMVADTARRYGLKVEPGVMDERMSYEQSTEAALNYLGDLKEMFGDWMVAIAAYNCGEYRMNSSMKKQGVTSYFKTNLPRETERYLFRIMVIKLIFENAETFGYYPDKTRIYKPSDAPRVIVDVDQKIYITDVCSVSGFTYKEFTELNPKILSQTLPYGRYTLNIPKGFVDKFIDAIKKLSDEDFKKNNNYGRKHYTVKEGDVLSSVSWATGVSVGTIKQLNHLKSNTVKPGQVLLIRD